MINFNDTGLIVQYIQNFLKDNYDRTIHLSDVYDKETHKTLIHYLQQPEIISAHNMKNILINNFTYREENPPNALIDGGGIWNFNYEETPDSLRFYTRNISDCLINGAKFITEHINEIESICNKYGWKLRDYTKFKKQNTGISKSEFFISKDNREQLLPTKDIIKMINLSTNDYILNKCFIDENNAYHGYIQDSKHYKISYIEAKPGDTFTITHGYKYACEMAIAYTEHTIDEIKYEGYEVNNIISHLESSPYGELTPGTYEVYHIPEDSNCTYLLIQMPFSDNLVSPDSQKINVRIGDVNQDGLINQTDLDLLREWVSANVNGETPPFVLSGPNLIAANINQDLDLDGNQIVNETDVLLLEAALQQGDNPDLGEVTYERQIDLTESDYDRLLIMYGNINEGNQNNILNIPIEDYQTDHWAIHKCFIPYLLGACIHRYSDIRDITWLQEQIQSINPKYIGKYYGLYDKPEDFVLDNECLKFDTKMGAWKYYQRNMYTGYILDNKQSPLNGFLRREANMEKSLIQIINGRWYIDNQWTKKIVLEDGSMTSEEASNSLQQIIQQYQFLANEWYKLHNGEQIKFCFGYVDPLTEKYLKQIMSGQIKG